MNLEYFEMLRDERVRERIRSIAEMLEKKFAKMIVDNFNNDIGKFMSWWMKFGIYAKNARTMSLPTEETIDFAIMRKNFNKWLGVSSNEVRKLNTPFRYLCKLVRVPMELLDHRLYTQFNLKAINAGKSLTKNEHWTKKYIPDSKHFESIWKKHQEVVAVVEQPKVEQPKVEQPKVEEHIVEQPKVEEHAIDEDLGISVEDLDELTD